MTLSARNQQERPWARAGRWLPALALVLLASCTSGGGGGGPGGGPATQVTVPDVTGHTQAGASALLGAAGLTVGSVTTASSGAVAAGLVISQSPAAGSAVAPGSAVGFTVSTGPAVTTVEVPSVTGLTQAAASALLGAADLTLGSVTTASSGTVAAGLVISQSPAAGSAVAPGSAVALVISSGAGGGGGGFVGVEPIPSIVPYGASVAVDSSGRIHATMDGQGQLYYMTCAAGCERAAGWSSVVLSPGVSFQYPQLRVTPDGKPRIAIDNIVSGTWGVYVGACDAGCTSAAAWSFTKVTMPATQSTRVESHYFAASGSKMLLAVGSATTLSAVVCDDACGSSASWTIVPIGATTCSAPNVAVAANGAMAVSCDTIVSSGGGGVSQVLQVYTCAGGCTDPASWHGVTGLLQSEGLHSDLAILPDGTPFLAASTGAQPDPGASNKVAILTCGPDCTDPNSWVAGLVSDVSTYREKVGIAIDEQGRIAIGFNGTPGDGTGGLYLIRCTADCLTSATAWTTALVDDATRLNTTHPMVPPSGCQAALWMPVDLGQVAAGGGRIVTQSLFRAVGLGGACQMRLFELTDAYTYLMSLNSYGLGSW